MSVSRMPRVVAGWESRGLARSVGDLSGLLKGQFSESAQPYSAPYQPKSSQATGSVETMWSLDCFTSCYKGQESARGRRDRWLPIEFFGGGRLDHPNPYRPKSPRASVLVTTHPAAPNAARLPTQWPQEEKIGRPTSQNREVLLQQLHHIPPAPPFVNPQLIFFRNVIALRISE